VVAGQPSGRRILLLGWTCVWFMFVNGAFIFVTGPMRWVGAAAALAVLAAWYRGRGRKAEHA
jgi:hypothetical protein